MLRNIFTYLLTLTLLITVAAPTIISFSDYDLCENSILLDIEDDTDSKENSEEIEEIKEVKILSIPFTLLNAFKPNICSKVKATKTQLYQTVYYSLESPPPKFS